MMEITSQRTMRHTWTTCVHSVQARGGTDGLLWIFMS